MKPFSGICIGGPWAGKMYAHHSPTFRVVSCDPLTITDYSAPTDCSEVTFELEHTIYQWNDIYMGGAGMKFWLPINMSIQQGFDELTETYANYCDLKD